MASVEENEEGQEYLSTSEKIQYFQKLLKKQTEEASKIPEDRQLSERFQQNTPQRIDFSWRDALTESPHGDVSGRTTKAAKAVDVLKPTSPTDGLLKDQRVGSSPVAVEHFPEEDQRVGSSPAAVGVAANCAEHFAEEVISPSTRASSSSPHGPAGYLAEGASASPSLPRAAIAEMAREAMQKRQEGTPTRSKKRGDPRRDDLAAKAYQRYQDVWQSGWQDQGYGDLP